MDLDDELRELFTSDRLDVAVRPDAEQIIVTGARRVRRRRIAAAAASGALGVVITVAAGFALAGGDPDAMPPATSTTTTRPAATSVEANTQPSTTTAPSSPPVVTTTQKPRKTNPPTTSTTRTGSTRPVISAMVIGPTGYRELALGQTLEEAQASGRLGPLIEDSGGCAVYEIQTDVMTSGGRVYVAGTVQAIAPLPAKTPEGVGKGWTVEQVKEVYPDLDEQAAESGSALVSVPGNAGADYRLEFAGGVVTSVALLSGSACGG